MPQKPSNYAVWYFWVCALVLDFQEEIVCIDSEVGGAQHHSCGKCNTGPGGFRITKCYTSLVCGVQAWQKNTLVLHRGQGSARVPAMTLAVTHRDGVDT